MKKKKTSHKNVAVTLYDRSKLFSHASVNNFLSDLKDDVLYCIEQNDMEDLKKLMGKLNEFADDMEEASGEEVNEYITNRDNLISDAVKGLGREVKEEALSALKEDGWESVKITDGIKREMYETFVNNVLFPYYNEQQAYIC